MSTALRRLSVAQRRLSQLRVEQLEDRLAPAVVTFNGDAQHTGISAWASQPLQAIHWYTFVDTFFSSSFGHYGGPLVTDANTVIVPMKTGPSATPNFHVTARNGTTGQQVWDVATDWTPSAYTWFQPYQPVLATATNRVYYPGNGGTIYYRTNPDSPIGTIGQLAFYGTLSDYFANQENFNTNVKVDSPLTADNQGNIFFSFRAGLANPAGLVSGIARIAADGTGSWISASAAAGNDPNIDIAAPHSAMALSQDGTKLYVCVRSSTMSNYARLVALNTTTLAPIHISGVLKDPRGGGVNNARMSNNSTASPTIGPDGRVFFGVLANPDNGFRGWMLQYSADLQTVHAPGGFGWDTTVSIIPPTMVPQYTGSSPYLIFSKYNFYTTGQNKVAILDPFDTQPDPGSGGLPIMKEILTILSPTPYPNNPTHLTEWCINAAAVDPATNSVLLNNEDGKVYRWHLPTNSLTEVYTLTGISGQPYTPTVIGKDGTVYYIVDGVMVAMGKTPGISIADAIVASPDSVATVAVTLDYPLYTPITVQYQTANGTANAGIHYTTTSGTLTFDPGEMTKSIAVPITPGAVTGASASFFINLTTPTGAVIDDNQSQITLLNRPPRVQGVIVNGGAVQRSRVTSIAVQFDQPVTFSGAPQTAFQLVRQTSGSPIVLGVNLSMNPVGTLATLSFIGGAIEYGSLSDGLYTLTVNANVVINVAGRLDGNGDGSDGDDYLLVGNTSNGLFRLFGDVDGNASVDGNDFGQFGVAFGSGLNPAFDFDGNGIVDATDFAEFGNRFGVSL